MFLGSWGGNLKNSFFVLDNEIILYLQQVTKTYTYALQETPYPAQNRYGSLSPAFLRLSKARRESFVCVM